MFVYFSLEAIRNARFSISAEQFDGLAKKRLFKTAGKLSIDREAPRRQFAKMESKLSIYEVKL